MTFIESEVKTMEEESVYSKLKELFEKKQPFYFLSGAGSGKTYALVNIIRDTLRVEGINLKSNGQKIACITFTNNAKNEISNRLNNNDLVYISTIHAFLWGIIKNQMECLIDIHKNYLSTLAIKLNKEISEGEKSAHIKYNSLSSEEINVIHNYLSNNEDAFKSSTNFKAKDFWSYLSSELGEEIEGKINSNKQDLIDIFNQVIRIRKYQDCIEKVTNNDEGYQTIVYSEKNIEILHKNIIGHNTLLVYGLMMVEEYPFLANIVADLFPHIFIDEYQDTDSSVVKFFSKTFENAKKDTIPFTIGVFGDPSQNIYNVNFCDTPLPFEFVYKDINRRSHIQIINCINAIRGNHQKIKQTSLYTNKNNGSCKIHILAPSDLNKTTVNEVISYYSKEWEVSDSNKLACLVLKNEMLSDLCDFRTLYTIVKDIYIKEDYRKFNAVNEEFVVSNIDKMGRFPSALYSLIKPLYLIRRHDESPISDLFPSLPTNEYSLKRIINTIKLLSSIKSNSLGSFLLEIVNLIKKTKNSETKALLTSMFPKGLLGEENHMGNLLKSSGLKKVEFDSEHFQKLLNLDLVEIFNWIDYSLSSKTSEIVNFMTCHSSKGLEYENVIIFLEDHMHSNKQYFSSFFNSDINAEQQSKIEEARRLLYVSASRAIKNLRVVFFTKSDIDKDRLEEIFSEIEITPI